MNTLISADNTWVLMSIMVLVVAFSIWMEQTYAWASKISGAIIALICALLLTNLKIIPASAPIFDDVVWGFAVPMAIPLLLLQVNLSKIWKETGRMLGIFLIGALGTVAGAVLGVLILAFAAAVVSMVSSGQALGEITSSIMSGFVASAASVLVSFLLCVAYLRVLRRRDERNKETSGIALACVAMAVALFLFVLVACLAPALV